MVAMGNMVFGTQYLVAQAFVPQNETNNNDLPKNPHSFTNTAAMSPLQNVQCMSRQTIKKLLDVL